MQNHIHIRNLLQCFFSHVNICWKNRNNSWQSSSKYLWTFVSCVSGGLDLCRMVDMRQEVAALAQPGHQELQHPGQRQNIFRKYLRRILSEIILQGYLLNFILCFWVIRSYSIHARDKMFSGNIFQRISSELWPIPWILERTLNNWEIHFE